MFKKNGVTRKLCTTPVTVRILFEDRPYLGVFIVDSCKRKLTSRFKMYNSRLFIILFLHGFFFF